jgi:hypothetical protein
MSASTQTPPLPKLTYSQWALGLSFVVDAIAGYAGFEAAHPVASLDLFALGAGLQALAAYLRSLGD